MREDINALVRGLLMPVSLKMTAGVDQRSCYGQGLHTIIKPNLYSLNTVEYAVNY